MKKLTLFIVLLCLITATAKTQSCLPEGIIFTYQSQIDSFQVNYPNCTEIEGDVTISGDEITNLSGLMVIKQIGGDLIIGNPEESYQDANLNLTSLEGLENLTFVGGSLKIYKNGALINLVGLDNLGSIGEDIIIDRNTLVNLYGLENLNAIGGDFFLDYNGDLHSLSGLENLSSINGSLKIWHHYGLKSLTALENLNFVGKDIELINNNELNDLEGLEKITHIGRDLIMKANGSQLNSLSGLDNLTSIGRDINMGLNYGLVNYEGLDSLKTVGRNVYIYGGYLTSLTGLENLVSIGGDLSIVGSIYLTNLTGLENVESIGGDLKISSNEILTSIVELESIDASSISNLYILWNDALSECHVQYICDFLASPNGSINITGNASGCLNPVEVADSCGYFLGCLPNGNYHLDSQGDVDNFQSLYPGCSALNGDVLIYNGSITNLNGLNQITSIEGNLEISNVDNLLNLKGLDCLSSIGGSLRIVDANILSEITSLENLVTMGGDLIIKSTEELARLDGLENLTSLGGNLELGANDKWGIWWGISGNESLANLDGLSGLTSISGDLGIIGSGALKDLNGLESLEYVGGDLEIYANDSLTDLNGLKNLSSVEGSLFIGKVTLHDHDAYEMVTGNQSLISLKGMNGLGYINKDLWIIGNEKLTNLSGLDNIDEGSINSLWIFENPALASCEAESICNYLKSPDGIVDIHDNAPGCNSNEEVDQACDSASSVHESNIIQGISIQPNPFYTSTTIEYELNQPQNLQITIYNHLGQLVDLIEKTQLAGKQQMAWDAKGLSSGVYFCVLKTESRTQTTKLIKLK